MANHMKALILAGGFGTRLRPLSCTRPKLMFPVANRPVLDWILESLAKNRVKTVILAVNYGADMLLQHFGRSKYGMDILYSRENKPLGTGGPVKKAEKLLNEDEEPFFVLNGDVLSSIDYTALFQSHKSNGAQAISRFRLQRYPHEVFPAPDAYLHHRAARHRKIAPDRILVYAGCVGWQRRGHHRSARRFIQSPHCQDRRAP